MAKDYTTLQAQLEARPDHPQRAEAARQQLAAEDQAYFHRLRELRQARNMTQVTLAQRLQMVQPSVSRLERQTDLYVSTLRRYIEAAGGRLEIRVVFDDLDAEIRFDDFETIDHDNPDIDDSLGMAL